VSKNLRNVASLFLFAALSGAAVHVEAQAVAVASITGRVLDAQSAVVPNVEIKCLSTETGVMHSAVTNNDGLYTLPSLPVGHYSLEATKQGFQTYVRKEITLQVNDNLQININLTIGQVSERVEVNADTAAVQTQQSSVSQVIDGRRIAELPLNGRDPTQLITISGAAVNHSDGTNTGSKSFFSSQSISIAGGLCNGTNYLLDGGDNNDSFTNVNMPFPFPDALAEFSVETSSCRLEMAFTPVALSMRLRARVPINGTAQRLSFSATAR